MIYQIATKLAIKLSRSEYIDKDEIELVTYGMFSVISKIMYGVISFVIGIACKCPAESICFYLSFLYLKKYAGGIHAKTEFRCFLLSVSSITVSILMITFSKKFISTEITVFMLFIISCVLIICLSPVPSKERMLDENECIRYNRISKCRVFSVIVVSLLMCIFQIKYVCLSIKVATILVGTLLTMGKMRYRKTAT